MNETTRQTTQKIKDLMSSRGRGRTAALHDEICKHPDDIDRRLVFADWLEESGEDPARAELIRVQHRLHEMGPEPKLVTDLVLWSRGIDYWTTTLGQDLDLDEIKPGIRCDVETYVTPTDRQMGRTSKRYHNLLITKVLDEGDFGTEVVLKRDELSVPWLGKELVKREKELFAENNTSKIPWTTPLEWILDHGDFFRIDWWCGFPDHVELRLKDWFKHLAELRGGPAALLFVPLRSIYIRDKEPQQVQDRYHWLSVVRSDWGDQVPRGWTSNSPDARRILPVELMYWLTCSTLVHSPLNVLDRVYATAELAISDLNAACFNWARQQVRNHLPEWF